MRSLKTAVSLFVLVTAVLAQSDRSTVTGTISDPAGAVVANAPVEARNLATGATYRAASTTTGNYALLELPVGNYEVSIAVPGFKKYVRSGLELQAAQTYRIDVVLEVGAASESVTVTEAAPLLKTESGELSHNITGQDLNQLPVLGIGFPAASNSGVRNPFASTQLLPGGQFSGDVSLRVNGTPANTSTFRVEGQDSTNQTITTFTSQNQPSVEAIQEFSVQTSNYAAEFGQAGGAIFVATMKSGTNQFHGSTYDYFVNEVLNANTPLVNSTRPRARRNDYGFSLGGPVKIPKVYDGRNRTFFFYNFEQFRETQVVNNVPVTVPAPAYRTGDFSQAYTGRTLNLPGSPVGVIREGQIFDPNTQRTVNGQVIRDPYLNNRILPAAFDPVAVNIQNLFPAPAGPNAGALINNYLPAYDSIRHTDLNSIKVDQILTQKSKLSVFYNRTHTWSPYSQTLQGDGLPPEISFGNTNADWVHTTRINYDYTLTPTLLLHIGAGYTNQHGPSAPSPGDFNPASIGLKGTYDSGKFPIFSALCVTGPSPNFSTAPPCTGQGGIQRFGRGTPGGREEFSIFSFRPTGNASLTWIRGNHTYKAGAEFQVMNFMYRNWNGAGTFNYSPVETSLPWLQTQNTAGIAVGFTYASFLLGAVDNADIGSYVDQHQGKQNYALFLQDSWKVTRKLTLDYGLRWDYLTYLREGAGRQASFDPNVLNRNAGNLPGGLKYDGSLPGRCQCDFAHNYPYAIGPRVGVAYQITPKTVFRAGAGIVYANTSTYDNFTLVSSTPVVSPGQYAPAFYLKNGYPVVPVPWPYFDPSQYPNIPGQIGSLPAGAGYVDPNAGRPPRQIQWSVGVQREIVPNLVVEASYVGNRGAWWPANNLVAYNALSVPRLQAAGLNLNNPADQSLLLQPMSSAAVISRGFKIPYATFPTGSTLAQALRPFPQFGNIGGQFAPLGDTWYDSMQFKATKRLSHGLDASYSLVWQKSLTIAAEGEGSGGGGFVNDVFNRQNAKGLSRFDEPLVSILSLDYTTPRWGSNKALSWATRDWTIGGLFTYRSGTLISAPASSNPTLGLSLFQTTFANRVPGQPLFTQDLNCHCFDPSKVFVLNPAAWSQPANDQFGGQAYYTDYRYQRRPSENMSLGRIFRIKERMSLSLRMEFTNIFNRTEMQNPTATSATQAQTKNGAGLPTSGFGFIPTSSTFAPPRQGVIVGRFQF